MKCECEETFDIEGVQAIKYALEHLELIHIDSINWEKEYRCPITDTYWIMDYPHSEAHGGGAPRLRRKTLI